MGELEWKKKQVILEQYAESLDDLQVWKYRVSSTLLVASATVFSVLLMLGGNKGDISLCPFCIHIQKISYLLLTCANLLCILFLTATLYETVELNKRICNTLRGKLEQRDPLLTTAVGAGLTKVSRRKFFVFCEKASYVSFLIFVAFLLVNSFLKALC